MYRIKVLLLIAFLASLSVKAFSQHSLFYNSDTSVNYVIQTEGFIDVGSNNINGSMLKNIILSQEIDNNTKEYNLQNAKEVNRAGTTSDFNISFAKYAYSDTINHIGYYAKIGSDSKSIAFYPKEAFEMVFFGNSNLVGDTLNLSPIGNSDNYFSYDSYNRQYVKGGLILKQKFSNNIDGTLAFGISIGKISSLVNLNCSRLRYHLNDVNDTMYLDMHSSIIQTDKSNKDIFAYNGTSIAADINYILSNNKNFILDIEITDLFNTILLNKSSQIYYTDTSLQYYGFHLEDIDNIEEQADSILNSIFMYNYMGKSSFSGSSNIKISFLYSPIINKLDICASIQSFSASLINSHNRLLYSQLSLSYYPFSFLRITPIVSYGGLSNWHSGLEIGYYNKKHKVNTSIGINGINTLFAPDKAKGFAAFLTISKYF